MANTILHLDASARQTGSISRANSAHIVSELNADTVLRRDLNEGVPFLNEEWVTATFTPPEDRTEAQAKSLELSDALVKEVQAADTIVIGTGLYNFHVPAVLKAWLDQISRAGVTFKYTENGPKGLLEGKKVIVTIATGGVPVGTENDFASPYLKMFFGFLGLTDVTILNNDDASAYSVAA
ncbi:MAG: FMN-dependent NADH-azoreductase [Cognatishimia sp.]|uniref:FMN-dependent NADH-azoreductase n=1 Tax=Cognatishimia sp. 1_MG-2023 TaxID=3062642 RepID=UPI0026E25390|nr:NAD(P)H-dependent oxidoreductase [Cognatishimia sp. 1_MG-2023]MDO6726814.1 NAD(P)H-dependent oxidoreductase [Cognatishimia sp. 1_MG-2023]